jgi:hypothetical protein
METGCTRSIGLWDSIARECLLLASESSDRQIPDRVWSLSSSETRNRINTGEIRRQSEKGLICVVLSRYSPRLIAVLTGWLYLWACISCVYEVYSCISFVASSVHNQLLHQGPPDENLAPCVLHLFLRAKQGRRARPALSDQLSI